MPRNAGRRGGACDAVAARDVRIRAVVDVEQRALRTFEQQRIATGSRLRATARRRRRPSARDLAAASASNSSRVRLEQGRRSHFVVVLEHEVVQVEQRFELGREQFRIQQVLHAHRASRNLVFVCGPDAATSGADLLLAHADAFSRAWSSATWIGRTSGHAGEIFRRRRTSTPAASSSANLRAAAPTGTGNDAVADVDGDIRVQRTRRDEAQDGLLAADHQRVAGVVARPGSARRRWRSRPGQSTILPLPSSPHWVPMTTTFLPMFFPDAENF